MEWILLIVFSAYSSVRPAPHAEQIRFPSYERCIEAGEAVQKARKKWVNEPGYVPHVYFTCIKG